MTRTRRRRVSLTALENSGGAFLISQANCIPAGIEKTPERLQRPLKYSFIAHAERGAIYSAAKEGIRLNGATMYLNWFPCADCAEAIVAAGIRRLVAERSSYEIRKDDPRYTFDLAMQKLTEAGVEIDWWEKQ